MLLDLRSFVRLFWWVAAAALPAPPAAGFVGNALLLTEQAESLALRGRVEASMKARERAHDYARLTLERLQSRRVVDEAQVGLYEAVLAENELWLGVESYRDAVAATRSHIALVQERLTEAKAAELRWRWIARGESEGDAEDALTEALAARSRLVADLANRLEEGPEESGEADFVPSYLRYALIRMEWSLRELEAQAAEWRAKRPPSEAA